MERILKAILPKKLQPSSMKSSQKKKQPPEKDKPKAAKTKTKQKKKPASPPKPEQEKRTQTFQEFLARYIKMKAEGREIIPRLSFNIPGVYKIIIPPEHQQLMKCLVGRDVNAEDTSKYVPKDTFEYLLEVQKESSEFISVHDELISFPNDDVLVIYIPDESKDYDQFYICLSEQSEKILLKLLEKIRNKRQERLTNSIFKTVKPWRGHGSDIEVEELMLKENRPLLEVVAEARYPFRPVSCQFRLRLAEMVTNGYAAILPGRSTFANIFRSTIDNSVQVTPSLMTNETQTTSRSTFRNAATQYEFKYDEIKKFTIEFKQGVKSFMNTKLKLMDEMIAINNEFNFYENDYDNLVRTKRFTHVSETPNIKIRTTIMDHNVGKDGKVIYKLSWHPFWSGIAAIFYAFEAPRTYKFRKATEDWAKRSVFELTPVMLWDALDNVAPKLILETPRDITALSFCPFDENIIVGGCFGGEIIIWDLTGKLELSKQTEILTTKQQYYRTRLRPLSQWIKCINDKNIAKVTAVSDLEYSHKRSVTSIEWISPNRSVSKCGIVTEVSDEQRSLQFLTSSKDGTILFWDLLVNLPKCSDNKSQKNRLCRLERRPSALATNISPYSKLHRVLRPIFKLNVFAPDTNDNLILTQLKIKSNLNLSPALNHLAIGTAQGDFLLASWSGLDVDSGLAVNMETCKIENYGKYHDGPVLVVCISEYFLDLTLTVGGKIFALWKADFMNKPLLWRKCQHRYTYATWDNVHPSIFFLTRNDGFVEMWNLKVRSDQYQYLKVVSGRTLTGIYTSPPCCKDNFLGIAGYKGLLRVCHMKRGVMQITEEEKWSTYCQRLIERKLAFVKWQEGWKLKNAEWIALRRERELFLRRKIAEDKQQEIELIQAATQTAKKSSEEILQRSTSSRPKTGFPLRSGSEQWRKIELRRLSAAVSKNRGLDKKILEKERIPLIKEDQSQELKRAKQMSRQQQSKKFFQKAVAIHFPEIVVKRPPPTPDPYGGGDFLSQKETYMQSYEIVAKTTSAYIKKRKCVYYLGWYDIVQKTSSRAKKRQMWFGFNGIDDNLEIVKEKLIQHEQAFLAQRDLERVKPSDKMESFHKIFSDILLALDAGNIELCNIMLNSYEHAFT